MAIANDPKSQDRLNEMFKEQLKPIWPNLTRKQTKMEFAHKRYILSGMFDVSSIFHCWSSSRASRRYDK